MSNPDTDAHTRQGHEVGEHLNTGVDVDHSSEMAQANDDCAGGHEDDEGQAHEHTMCNCHAIDFVQEWDQEWREPSRRASASPTTSSSAGLGASSSSPTSAPTSAPAGTAASRGTSISLCACNSDCLSISADQFRD